MFLFFFIDFVSSAIVPTSQPNPKHLTELLTVGLLITYSASFTVIFKLRVI